MVFLLLRVFAIFNNKSDEIRNRGEFFSYIYKVKNSKAMSTTDTTGNRNSDLQDSPRDAERLQPEETTIDLPDVTDIPGQENITVMPLGELADTTISSDDEEGKRIFGDEEDVLTDPASDVTRSEKEQLRAAANYRGTEDEASLRRAALESRDMEGAKLNEGGFGEDKSGSDLDVPGSEADNANESIGEEDEENNNYSLGGQDQ